MLIFGAGPSPEVFSLEKDSVLIPYVSFSGTEDLGWILDTY